MSGEARTVHGTVAGTGAAITVKCSVTPKFVKLIRDASGGTHCSMEHAASMPAASALKTTDNGAGVVTSRVVTTNGVTIPVSPSGEFVIGADADINISGIGIHWFVME